VTTKKPISLKSIGVAVGIMVLVALLGGVITQLGPWYEGLKKPSWQPPGPAFGIIWSAIYLLTASSAVLAWRTTSNGDDGRKLIALFGINCVLNLMWSFLFFQLQRPDWALYQVGVFWISILALIIFIWPRSKFASLLLLPYIVWVSIASFLNLAVVQLNGPFS
jgi:translocator protein